MEIQHLERRHFYLKFKRAYVPILYCFRTK